MKFSSTDVRRGVLDIEVQADSVNTGSRMKDDKLKGRDFFNAKDSPSFRSSRLKSLRPVQTRSNWKGILRFAA
jgi:polyisoprenoid-binding protein YceI